MFPIRDIKPRRSSPTIQTNYRRYKGSLEEDFSKCCGYCGVHHVYFGSGSGFHIDHFAPKSKFPELETEYTNLIYSCPICNIAKSNDWPSDNGSISVVDGMGYIDPCEEAYDELFFRDNSGKIISNDGCQVAAYMYRKLKLNLKRREIFWLADYFESTVEKIHKKLKILHDDDPLCNELKELLEESLDKMIQYRNFQREF